MRKISWDQLEQNASSAEVGFETFVFQLVNRAFKDFGYFTYPYNTPGSEFYLTLTKDCPDLEAKANEVVGWQCKFWRGRDENNSPLGENHRSELQEGLKNSIRYRHRLRTWIVCTPGHFSDTSTKSNLGTPLHQLNTALSQIAPNVNIRYWHRELYESFLMNDIPSFQGIWNYYFSTKMITGQELKKFTLSRLEILRTKYDTDLYTAGDVDEKIKRIFQTPALEHYFYRFASQLRQLIISLRQVKTSNDEICQIYFASRRLAHNIVRPKDGPYRIHNSAHILVTISPIFNKLAERFRKEREQLQKGRGVELTHSSPNGASIQQVLQTTTNLLAIIDNLLSICDKQIQRFAYVFGKAGYGKTCLSCDLVTELLSKDIPCLLLLGRDFREPTPRHSFARIFGLPTDWSFDDILAGLDALGLHYGIKIPIIIDGLNESMPTADIWTTELPLIQMALKPYDNVLFIATCRETYVKQVFEVTNSDKVENSYQLQGFKEENLQNVIDKYFAKYEISGDRSDVDSRLLRNPLLLKMFCIVNHGRQVSVHKTNIFSVFQAFIREAIERASTENNRLNHAIYEQYQKIVHGFCNLIWESRTRGVDYPTQFIKLFENEKVDRGLYQNLLDEDLFITRHMQDNGKETLEFTFDALAGYCVAHEVVIKGLLGESHELRKNILSAISPDSSTRHPLYDDIINSIIHTIVFEKNLNPFDFFVDSKFGEFLLPLTTELQEDWAHHDSLLKYFSQQIHNKVCLRKLCEMHLLKIIENNDYGSFDLLQQVIPKLSFVDINLIWAESIRKLRFRIAEYLLRIVDTPDLFVMDESTKAGQTLTFIALLFVSTSRHLRDLATRSFVEIGARQPNLIPPCVVISLKIKDAYVQERVLGASLGALSRNPIQSILTDLSKFLKKNVINNRRINHLLILDYAHSICVLANSNRVPANIDTFKSPRRTAKWHLDRKCIEKIANRQAAEWGYGHIRMDFAKYIINHLSNRWAPIRNSDSSKVAKIYAKSVDHLHRNVGFHYLFWAKPKLALHDALAMIVWRTHQLGFAETTFGEIDKEISNDRSNLHRTDNTYSVERYGKKFAWIAYFELYGQMLINGLLEPCYSRTFRTSSIDIDPTFPMKPPKESVSPCCFLPKFSQTTQSWINTELMPYFKLLYVTELPKDNCSWTLLYANVNQTSQNKNRFECFVQTILTKTDELQTVTRHIESNEDLSVLRVCKAKEFYYRFATEMYLRNVSTSDDTAWNSEDKLFELFCPVTWYSWESYHSSQNQTGPIPFLDQKIVFDRSLRFDLNRFVYISPDDTIAAKYLWDDSSEYLFINSSILHAYCRKNNLSIIWTEHGTRWGDFGENDTKLNPSYQDFRHIESKRIT